MSYTKAELLDSIQRVSDYILFNKRAPKTVRVGKNTLTLEEYKKLESIKELQTRIQNFITKNKAYPKYVLCFNAFRFRQPLYVYLWSFEKKTTKITSTDAVFNYFVQVFGGVSTIDEALKKIENRGYSYYYDDVHTNKAVIDRIKNKKGVNCTDSCQMIQHVATALGYSVHCLHVQCQSGGHVRLKLKHAKHTSGYWIYRDPAAILSTGNNNGIAGNIWCPNGKLIATDPQWYINGLNR